MSMISLEKTKTWIFDLDNTLYRASTSLFSQVDMRMRDYISINLNLKVEDAYKKQKEYFREYGTTLRGLMTCHDIDPADFLDFVHDINLDILDTDPVLKNALAKLNGRKYVFTNASRGHAERVMARLGIDDQFDDIFDIVDSGYEPKPKPHIYDAFIAKYDFDTTQAIMFEDMARNLIPAAERGMQCVWIETDQAWAQEGYDPAQIQHRTDDLKDWLLKALAD